ncbi:MAG TPA: adenosine deaminase [Eoetvoesiella sp.]
MNTAVTTPDPRLHAFIAGLPKAELHVHIEGTLEPELIFELAARNRINLPYGSVQELQNAYAFTDLQSFLDLYYAAASVLITERDFYDMTMAYLQRAQNDGVVHTEIMFDPQTHTARGVCMQTVFAGISRALRETQQSSGMSGYLIMSFLRHLSEDEAFETLDAALPLREQYQDLWIAIGLDSAERGNPPEKFMRLFKRCKDLGFRLVAHAGEEGPAAYVRDTLNLLSVDRIDHGVRSEEDPVLMQRLIAEQIPLTVCPLSNLKLRVIDTMNQHNVARLLRRGAMVTINSDDPAYFGGYVAENYMAVALALNLNRQELTTLAKNSLTASFLPATQKQILLNQLEACAKAMT